MASPVLFISQTSQEEAEQTKQYAIFVEMDSQSMETFLIFVQYQNNEDVLIELASIINDLPTENYPDNCSAFHLDVENLVSEQTAYEMCQTDISFRHMPKMLNGTLRMPKFHFLPTDTANIRVRQVDRLLSDNKLKNYIKPV